MSIQIIKKNQQASGQFNGGEILENKPIGFPREGGHLKPYSNLFYWAHAWSDKGSTIGLHPHQGFEIMSFVLEGSIEHFDTADNEWKKLNKGDAQIIRAGNGISHSEKLNAGAHMFQIWLDPNLNISLSKAASYSDYRSIDFPLQSRKGMTSKTYKGEGSPFQMDSAGIGIKEMKFEVGNFDLEFDPNKIHSVYIIEGLLSVEESKLEKDDFFILEDKAILGLKIEKEVSLFIIESPKKLDYLTYSQRMKMQH